jgi:hypothetical protein
VKAKTAKPDAVKTKPSDFEEEVVSKLKQWCGEALMWSRKQEVIEKFKTSSMWVEWVKAGLTERQLGTFMNRLKKK